MSIWTHVAAVIRVDDLRPINGRNLSYELPHWQHDIPTGSEGPLDVTGWENPMRNAMAAYTITIHGDLRDFEDSDAIVEWLEDRCKERKFGIRQACATIEVEGHEPITWTYRLEQEQS